MAVTTGARNRISARCAARRSPRPRDVSCTRTCTEACTAIAASTAARASQPPATCRVTWPLTLDTSSTRVHCVTVPSATDTCWRDTCSKCTRLSRRHWGLTVVVDSRTCGWRMVSRTRREIGHSCVSESLLIRSLFRCTYMLVVDDVLACYFLASFRGALKAAFSHSLWLLSRKLSVQIAKAAVEWWWCWVMPPDHKPWPEPCYAITGTGTVECKISLLKV